MPSTWLHTVQLSHNFYGSDHVHSAFVAQLRPSIAPGHIHTAIPKIIALSARFLCNAVFSLTRAALSPECAVDRGDFQLITWSKDKTLRFWPIDKDVLQSAGQPADGDR